MNRILHNSTQPLTKRIAARNRSHARPSLAITLGAAAITGFTLGFMVMRAPAVSLPSGEIAAIWAAADNAARSDYAQLVNNCYDQTVEEDGARGLYDCIAAGYWPN